MDSNEQTKELSYINNTAEKMGGYKATGLTQVKT